MRISKIYNRILREHYHSSRLRRASGGEVLKLFSVVVGLRLSVGQLCNPL